MRKLTVACEKWPIAGGFAISRGTKTHAEVVVATIEDDSASASFIAKGECVPYARYGESIESVIDQIESIRQQIESGIDTTDLQDLLPAGAARNALDCALWDYKAKTQGRSIFSILDKDSDRTVETVMTIGFGAPEEMAQKAANNAHRPILKIKLGGENDGERLRAVAKAAPNSKLVVDANEGWTPQNLIENLEIAKQCGVKLVEQPLPAENDALLAEISRPIPVCADESSHVSADLHSLKTRYDAVNIKLDKTGGLTEALKMLDQAKQMEFDVMVGCMVGTSLAMAPAFILAQSADYVDIDGPLLLAKDRVPGLVYETSTVFAPSSSLWG